MMTFRQMVFLGLIGISTLTLSACGFALRGTSASTLAPLQDSKVQLHLPDNINARTLKQALTQHLQLLNIQTQDSTTNQITINNLQLRRYKLVGTLTEVRLVLSADISCQLADKSSSASVQVERSYQHNEASVVTLDQQGDKAQVWLYDDLAKRIAEQYRANLLSAQ